MIWGYHYFRKHPFGCLDLNFLTHERKRLARCKPKNNQKHVQGSYVRSGNGMFWTVICRYLQGKPDPLWYKSRMKFSSMNHVEHCYNPVLVLWYMDVVACSCCICCGCAKVVVVVNASAFSSTIPMFEVNVGLGSNTPYDVRVCGSQFILVVCYGSLYFFIYSPHNWVGFHPLHTLNNQVFFYCSVRFRT